MTKKLQTLGIFGGTFDPVHLGHLHLTTEIQKELALEKIIFIPNRQPLLRNAPIATPQQRLSMLQLAIDNNPNFKIDDYEINHNKPSYTINTLQHLRLQNPEASLCLIMAMDQFQQLDRWHQWQELLKFAHIIVSTRPGYEAIDAHNYPIVHKLLKEHQTSNKQDLFQNPQGFIYLIDIHALSISGTEIRECIKNGENLSTFVPKSVADYINQHKLYC